MAEQYDVVVIGSGPAGRQAAVDLNNTGKSVAIIESYGFGGTCPLRGCEPKKLLVDAAIAVARSTNMQGQGLTSPPIINWPELMAFNRKQVDPVSDSVESWLGMEGIEPYFGQARFTGPKTVQVGDEELEGGKIVIATGAIPRPLDTPGNQHVSPSDHFLEMKEMPKRILFMGGGFISFELGHLAARAGANVTILEVVDRPLAPFDPDLVEQLVTATRDLGIDLRVNCPVTAVEKTDGGLIVRAGSDEKLTFEADMVVHGAGRVPAVEGMDLDAGGVDYSPKGIIVNEYLQSVSNPDVYAAGDVSFTTVPLTPVATMEGAVAAFNILNGNEKKSRRDAIPSAVYTYPVLATLGLREDQADEKGIEYNKYFKDTSNSSEHKRIGLRYGGIKLLTDKKDEKIIGVHILGQRAEEMINPFAFAMQHDLPISMLKETLWSYPSFVYNIKHILP